MITEFPCEVQINQKCNFLGPSLCENPEYPFDEKGILWCQATLAEFIPKALPVLFDPPNGVEDIQMECLLGLARNKKLDNIQVSIRVGAIFLKIEAHPSQLNH